MQLGTLPVARLLKLAWSPMMRQYQVGESFARAVHDRYGMAVLNRAWESPETMPRAEELRDFERWYRRVGAGGAAVAVR